MALSDREKQVLDELERNLYANDAKFANKISAPKSLRALVGGVALAVIGISIIVFAVIVQVFWFGLVGFSALLAGLVLASSNWMDQDSIAPASPKDQKPRGANSFEQRWDKRQGN